MPYAFVTDSQIRNPDVPLPDRAVRLTDFFAVPMNSVSNQRAAGYYLIVETPEPSITVDQRLIRNVIFQGGEAVVQWDTRQETPEEATIRIEGANATTIADRAIAAIAKCQEIIDDPTVTNAEAVTYIKDLATHQKGIIRYLFKKLDSAN